jgi:outer membrane receptor protein involved in Fe transport
MRSIRILAAAGLLLTASLATAFEGQVVAPDGQPLAGARVTVLDRAGMVVADGQGRFSVVPDPRLPFVLLVARPDGVAFRPVTVTRLPAEGRLEVRVRPLGETITVVSGAAPDLELPPAAAATVIGATELAQRRPDHLFEALANVPGASASGVGPAAVPALRGLPKGRTLILLDGGRVTTERRAGVSATFLDPDTVEEVEVVRGPGSVAYGSDAFGGLIRARSRMPEPGAPSRVRAVVLGGTAASERGAMAEVTTNGLGGGLLLGASWRKNDDYESPDGTVYNSRSETEGLRLAYQRELAGGVLWVGWRSDYGRDAGKPAPDSHITRSYYPEENSHRLDLGFERPGGGAWKRLSVAASWDSYQLILDKDGLGTNGVPISRDRSDVDARDYELRVEAERSLGMARLVVGLNAYGRYGLHAVNESYDISGAHRILTSHETSIDSARRDDLGVFTGVSGSVGRVRLSGGLRLDTVRTENEGGYFGDASATHGDVSGFAAVTVPLATGLDLTGQLARGFRDAFLSDRFYRGFTGRGFITGNPDLEPETSRQLDLALRYRRGAANLALYGYAYRINDLIERFKTDGNYFFRNRGDAQLRGLELEGTLDLTPRWSLQLGLWNERGEIRGPGDPVDDVPAPGGFVVLRHEPSPGSWWLIRLAAWARKTRPGPSEQEVPGHTVFDAGAGWRVGERLQVRVMVTNLLDRRYLVSPDEDAVEAPGLSLQISLRAVFGMANE